ncbi:MAG: exonuclease domain-containing protein [Anaerolineae bacterium]|jgi:DNA polymerase-3 subunit epsilon/ATP-dependent DNA helicase DinG|nr:exonuclease domain-containing protein [Anaerolineae bacterium]
MPKTYVSLDIETTGLDPTQDAIIEIGAVRFDQGRILERFETFVNPGRKLPPFITELTGIRDADLVGAISPQEAARRLADFAGRDGVVGHNVGFDLGFLRRQRILKQNPAIDTFEMAGILVPHASRYSLQNLVKELGIELPAQTHRALDDAEMTHALFMALMDRAVQLAPETLEEIVRLGRRLSWGATQFFSDALYARQRHGFQGAIGAQIAARRGLDAAGPLFAEEEELAPPLNPRREPREIDLVALTELLQPDGEIAAAYPAYEYRDQQVEMMQAVGEAFNRGEHLLVEAGTGTGKSLAYLVPAVEWAVMNEHRVVISTNTINLQEQLAHKDIPQLAQSLYEFRWQILKGRAHYLCRQQFEALRRRGPMSEDEMRVLAKILLWLPNTLDGDGDGLFLPTPPEREVWRSVSAATEACDPERCPFFLNDACFFYRARAKAESAHLLVVNHALLLADIATQNRVLPDYSLLIVDEAHHLESATTESLRYSVNWFELQRAFDSLLRSDRSLPGLLEEIAVASDKVSRSAGTRVREVMVTLGSLADRAQRALEALFAALEGMMEARTGLGGVYGARLRITDDLRDDGGWDGAVQLWSQADPPFGQLLEGLEQLSAGLDVGVEHDLPTLESARARLLAVRRVLGEARTNLHQLLVTSQGNVISWFEARNRGPFTVNTVPLHVGPLISEYLFGKKRSVILTSATLRIEGSFDYIRERLGVPEGASELALGSPFDYPSVALMYIVSDVPEPNETGYQKAVDETLIDLFRATQGRALGLFTSYSQLRTTTEAITLPLAREGITVLSQGSGTSRAQLLESFRTGERVVLLGTRSFWEGVDVSGEALSCLVIVKLPFDVPDDPIVAARAAMYEDSFNEYMVPEAVLRFLQGFGRLIRTASDLGLAVVLDRRLLTKSYGQRFIDSLPDPRVHLGRRAVLAQVAERWLAGRPLPSAATVALSDDGFADLPEDGDDLQQEPSWFWGA